MKEVGSSLKMGNNHVLLIGLSLALVAVDCATHDPKVNDSASTGDTLNSIKDNGDSNLDSNTVEATTVNGNKGHQVNISQNGLQGSTSTINSTVQLDLKEGSGVQNIPETKGASDDFKNEKSSDILDTKGLPNVGDHTGEALVRKDGFRGQECDPSAMCIDKDNNFVACLQVPGNEYPDIFLLIKNKGKGPRTISISAPDFVELENTQIHVPEKEDRKVKVSVRDGGTGHSIVMKEGISNCILDVKDLSAHNSGKGSDKSAKSYINLVWRRPNTAIVFFAALLMLASGWMCLSFRKRDSRSKYQRLDMELPVSVAVKTEPDVNDGWDKSWGDRWDEEEAPHTPLMPVTPRLSSKSLASRRLNKEGWKD